MTRPSWAVYALKTAHTLAVAQDSQDVPAARADAGYDLRGRGARMIGEPGDCSPLEGPHAAFLAAASKGGGISFSASVKASASGLEGV